MKKAAFIFLILILLTITNTAFAAESITSKEQLNQKGIKIGVSTGSISVVTVTEELPNAEMIYYGDKFLGYTDVANGKIDAFVYDITQMRMAIENGQKGVHILDETMDRNVDIAVGISQLCDIPDFQSKLNSFIAELKSDGTLDDMYKHWVINNNEDMPDIKPASDPVYHLTVGTTGNVPPYSFYKGTDLAGFDIELANRFAAWLNADLRFEVFDFDAVVSSIQSGKVDCVMSNLQISDERKESIQYSDVLYNERQGIMVRGDSSTAENNLNSSSDGNGVEGSSDGNGADGVSSSDPVPEITEFSQLKGKTVSMLTGAPFEELVRSKEPDVGEFTYFNNMTDILLALKNGKTDAGLNNNALAQLAVNRNKDLVLFPKPLKDGVFGFAFAKGDERREEWQAAFDTISEETKQAVWEKWTGADESLKEVPKQDWPGKNGTVQVAACDTLEPMSYAGEGGELKGFDIELILLMAKEMDVHVEFISMEFSALLPYIQAGKALMATGSIIATDERREAVDFIDYYPAAFVLVVRAAAPQKESTGFWTSVKQSFNKTFIREGRWQLFLQGICVTIVITVLSIILGTLLGFTVFMLCRNGNIIANGITKVVLWLVQGMPMVVLLMILYYLVFGTLNINGIIVAIIGFMLTFGAAVFGLLKMGVSAVNIGQYEAAYALGYSNLNTFFRVILPQAIPKVLPAYQGEIVGLIKATAIVGYIAVQDLTRTGDIVRSRTYEAFFPLIAITIIYFVLEGIIIFLVSRIRIKADPKRRSKESILKGVETHE